MTATKNKKRKLWRWRRISRRLGWSSLTLNKRGSGDAVGHVCGTTVEIGAEKCNFRNLHWVWSLDGGIFRLLQSADVSLHDSLVFFSLFLSPSRTCEILKRSRRSDRAPGAVCADVIVVSASRHSNTISDKLCVFPRRKLWNGSGSVDIQIARSRPCRRSLRSPTY